MVAVMFSLYDKKDRFCPDPNTVNCQLISQPDYYQAARNYFMLEKTPLEQLRETEPVRILVVDDDVDMLSLLKLYVQLAGYRVKTAESALEGLELLDEFTPDVMCVDFMMPGMDGQALARQIRSRQDMLYVPI